jgi:hypothetical protein
VRLFQNSGIYPGYRQRLDKLSEGFKRFADRRATFLADRYGACHFLKPVLDGGPESFFTNGDDEVLQNFWAVEHGLPSNASLEGILLGQIEEHRTEVFYNLDPMRYGSDFIRRLPGCVKKSIAWRAAPSPGADFGAYNAVVCNFPSILESYRARGWRAEYFSPAHDPEMDSYAANTDRPIDVLFVGGYSRHHQQRAAILEKVATLRDRYNIVFCLDRSRLTRLAETPIGHCMPLRKHRRPSGIRAVSHEPVFGRALYAMISKAKIVLNGAVDMAGSDRGNMRCFEAMGCGALMVSDDGNYPDGMENEQNMLLYQGEYDVVGIIQDALIDADKYQVIQKASCDLVRMRYGKNLQWLAFQDLVSNL